MMATVMLLTAVKRIRRVFAVELVELGNEVEIQMWELIGEARGFTTRVAGFLSQLGSRRTRDTMTDL